MNDSMRYYEGRLKSSETYKNILIECDQIRFLRGSFEKFWGLPKYSHRIWPDEVYTRVGWKVHRIKQNAIIKCDKMRYYEGRWKSSEAYKNILMEYDQMKFLCGSIEKFWG